MVVSVVVVVGSSLSETRETQTRDSNRSPGTIVSTPIDVSVSSTVSGGTRAACGSYPPPRALLCPWSQRAASSTGGAEEHSAEVHYGE